VNAPRRWLIAVALAVPVALGACGPRMVEQPNVRPYKRELPAMPTNTVPFGGPVAAAHTVYAPVPEATAAASLANPVRATAASLELGKRYYGYYCAMCHGPDGKGQVPVGQSYNPAPTALTSTKVQSMTDGEIYRAMLVGVGHEPALSATVPADRRWYVVSFVRTLIPHS